MVACGSDHTFALTGNASLSKLVELWENSERRSLCMGFQPERPARVGRF